jgi:hypothetical protein
MKEMGMQVAMGNDTSYPMIEAGTMPTKMHLGDVHLLQDVLFVPDLTKNHMSQPLQI